MTAPADALAVDRFAAVALLDRVTVRRLLRLWGLLDPGDLQGSFVSEVLPEASTVVVEAQAEAADLGASYVDAEARALGAGVGERVSPWGFAGTASDGRSLTSLLVQPFIQTLTALAVGAPAPVALDIGAQSLDRVVTTQVQDAARTAEAVGVAGNRDLAGYLRVVEPGACSRCIILAGRFYRFNEGFDRHPKCRCSHRPLTRDSEPQSPTEVFNGLSTAEQNRVFTKAGAEAIRLGAEPNLVVNARRGMSTAQNGSVAPDGNGGFQLANRAAKVDVLGQKVLTTTEGTSKRGLAYQRLGGGPRKKVTRLMPETLLAQAKDRNDAIRLLKLHGYLL